MPARAAIGLFGGTFDPVHAGHLAVMRDARQRLSLDELRILPAGDPWQKSGRAITPALHRVAMLKLAMADLPDALIDTRELHRSGPTYTIDTLNELRGELGREPALFWIIGSDAYARLHTWHRAKELPALTHFAVVQRDGGAVPGHFVSVDTARTQPAGDAVRLPIDTPAVSSTQIRDRVACGASIRGLTPDTVCDYIQTHHLYRE